MVSRCHSAEVFIDGSEAYHYYCFVCGLPCLLKPIDRVMVPELNVCA
jgi:hypothetical protein